MLLELSPKNDVDLLLEKKIAIATEGFTTSKFCDLILRDRNRLSKENVLTVSEYIMAMNREVNPRLSYKKTHYTYHSRVIEDCRDCKEILRYDKR